MKKNNKAEDKLTGDEIGVLVLIGIMVLCIGLWPLLHHWSKIGKCAICHEMVFRSDHWDNQMVSLNGEKRRVKVDGKMVYKSNCQSASIPCHQECIDKQNFTSDRNVYQVDLKNLTADEWIRLHEK